MKKIVNITKNIILAPFILYIYNLISVPFNIVIPINIFNTLIVGFLGIPGLVTLIIFKLIAF
ncbi:MAG: pro-sigmaK processing inhibitor BofA family protein [bacterium]|nr:pro-sigmaK processing inhibitor BofA family protein [bacterium]